ncbi:uncharacterized protein LOC132276869 [Cornus florida]|uniref:uncharacterized protein LOC132276869 n=1 Tax=Cornus florida TaxID=4283 RepID=UPI00289DD28B|nr:uncharacterized protein LOC132276869 [Cornus florida]
MQLLRPEDPTYQHEWVLEDIRTTFFKCTRWQIEETMDPINCPYHYFCDSTYPGNYPPAVDVLLVFFTTASYLATLLLMVMEIYGRSRQTHLGQLRRYLLPSGPVSLPIFVMAIAKGRRINTVFPLSCIGPAILQLIQISALAFDSEADGDVKYAFFKASTVSGIFHASLYLDSTILPYYTGFDALVSSTFSGECTSCVCRKEALVVGGKFSYRGWSLATLLVAGTLCLRIIYRISSENRGKTLIIKSILENLGWILITMDSVHLIVNSPPERSLSRDAAFAASLVLICLHVLKKACTQLTQWQWHSRSEK